MSLELFDQQAKENVAYMKSHRASSMNSINTLAKKKGFIDAFNSEMGKNIMSVLIKKYQDAFDKIASLEATEKDKITYEVIGEIMDKFIAKINDYETSIRDIDKKIKDLDAKNQ